MSTCRSTRLYKKRWIYWEADGHLTLFCGIPLLLDISMSKSSMFITIKSWSARALLWCPKKHEFQLFCFLSKGRKNNCQIDVGYKCFTIQIRILFVTPLWRSSLACFEEHEWQFKLEKTIFFGRWRLSLQKSSIIVLIFGYFALKIEFKYKIDKSRKNR